MSDEKLEAVEGVLGEMLGVAQLIEDGNRAPILPQDLRMWAERIKAATARNAKTFWNMLEGAAAAMDGMREERDRAVKYANAAPHPGSASWKEMQAAFEAAKERKPEENYGNVAELRKTLNSIECLCAVVDHYDDPEREEHLADAILEILAKVRLSRAAAPPRNCDRYGDAKSALDAFIIEKRIKNEDVDVLNLRDFFDWLFEQAEGESHA